MQIVKFRDDYDHITPSKTTAYKAGQTVKVTNDAADDARAAGKLEEDNGRGSDTGSPASDPSAPQGAAGRRRAGQG